MENIALQIDLQPEFLLAINETPEQFSKEIKLWAAMSMYCFGKVNMTTASAFSGYNHKEFEAILQNHKVPSAFDLDYLKSNNVITNKSKRYFGCGKHLIKSISDDFTEPLSDFKDYMP